MTFKSLLSLSSAVLLTTSLISTVAMADPVPYSSMSSSSASADPKNDCTAKKKKNQIDGAVVGGVIGAVAGNMIAGKKNKTLGTVAGGAAGAVVGAKIGKDKAKCGPHMT